MAQTIRLLTHEQRAVLVKACRAYQTGNALDTVMLNDVANAIERSPSVEVIEGEPDPDERQQTLPWR